MNLLTSGDITYFLFVIPGFFLVWTYRHFTKAQDLGQFEYAAWSLLWGVVELIFLYTSSTVFHLNFPSVPLSGPGALGSLIGAALAFAVTISFPLGLIGAFLSHTGLFGLIDELIFKVLKIGGKK